MNNTNIYWSDTSDGNFTSLYLTNSDGSKTNIGSIQRHHREGKDSYLLQMRYESSYFGSHDLHANNMEQAKQIASMKLLKFANDFLDHYREKVEELSAIMDHLNHTIARFTEAELQFQDIEFNDSYTGLNCQISDAMDAKLEHALGLPQEEGKWYNFYAAYDYSKTTAYIVYTENTDESCKEVVITLTKLEESYVTKALEHYVLSETKCNLYSYIEDAYRENIAVSLKNHGDYALMQLPDNSHGSRFSSLTYQAKRNGRIQTVHWKTVYTGSLEKGIPANNIHQMLEAIYTHMNVKTPEDYSGRSMSVSDIVAVNEHGNVEFWYCDSIGFTQI